MIRKLARGNSYRIMANLQANMFILILLILPTTTLQTCNVDDNKRIDCGWHGIDQSGCEGRNCCWKSSSASGFPWCFFDSVTASKLKTVKGCDFGPPVTLQCDTKEKITIHDVYYGSKTGVTDCSNSGHITCFNPNATNIVRGMCKDNSTCTVSPSGSIWAFDPHCNALNELMIIHYMCELRAVSTSILMPSSSIESTTALSTSFDITMSLEASTSTTAAMSFETPTTVTAETQKSTSSSMMDTIMTSLYEEASETSVFTTSSPIVTSPGPTSDIAPSQTETTPSIAITRSFETTLINVPSSITESPSIDLSISSTMEDNLSIYWVPSSSLPQSITVQSTMSNGMTSALSSSSGMSSSLSSSSGRTISLSSTPTTQLISHSKSTFASKDSSYVQITSTLSASPATVSLAVTSSIAPTLDTGVLDTNKGRPSTITYVGIGVGSVAGVIFLLVLTVWGVKKRFRSVRHEIMTDDLPTSGIGAYSSVPLKDGPQSYDNPRSEHDDEQVYNNSMYSEHPI